MWRSTVVKKAFNFSSINKNNNANKCEENVKWVLVEKFLEKHSQCHQLFLRFFFLLDFEVWPSIDVGGKLLTMATAKWFLAGNFLLRLTAVGFVGCCFSLDCACFSLSAKQDKSKDIKLNKVSKNAASRDFDRISIKRDFIEFSTECKLCRMEKTLWGKILL